MVLAARAAFLNDAISRQIYGSRTPPSPASLVADDSRAAVRPRRSRRRGRACGLLVLLPGSPDTRDAGIAPAKRRDPGLFRGPPGHRPVLRRAPDSDAAGRCSPA